MHRTTCIVCVVGKNNDTKDATSQLSGPDDVTLERAFANLIQQGPGHEVGPWIIWVSTVSSKRLEIKVRGEDPKTKGEAPHKYTNAHAPAHM